MSAPGNSILVPIDSTEQTIIALGQTYNLARLTNSKIVLFFKLISSLFFLFSYDEIFYGITVIIFGEYIRPVLGSFLNYSH